MESIEKLREYTQDMRKRSVTPGHNPCADDIDGCLDEIEREIAERYMRLPVDADGEPIHVGDEMESDNERFVVCAVAPGRVHRWHVHDIGDLDKGTVAYPPDSLRHFKPRTVEDAVRDFVNSVVTFKGSRDGIPIVGIDDSLWRDYFDAFADEIRELLGVEE